MFSAPATSRPLPSGARGDIRRTVSPDEPTLRVANVGDAAAIDTLMKESIVALFPAYYDEQQTASSVVHVGRVDAMLIDDATYYVLESEGEIVGCGGWSKRDRLYAGSADAAGDSRLLDPGTEPGKVRAMFVRGDWTRRGLGRRIIERCETDARADGFRELSLMATLPGVPLYVACGFEALDEADVTLTDGVLLPCVAMRKDL